MKKCICCKVKKPIGEYYKHPQMGDGHLGKCKDCCKEQAAERMINKREYILAYEKSRMMLPHRIEARSRYAKTDNGKASKKKTMQKYKEKYPFKYVAKVIFGNAVRGGKIKRPETCSKCGEKTKIQGHHNDYSKPLDVVWLCVKCHTIWHRNNEAIYPF